MPKTITKTVYTFTELLEANKAGTVTSRAVDKAREWMIEGVGMFDWHEFTLDTWKEALEQIGFESPDIAFSGFGSQGDGASFTCKSVDVAKLVDFMATNIQPSNVITGTPEDFRPWLVFKAKGKTPANVQYRRIPVGFVNAYTERISNQYSHENTVRFHADSDTYNRKAERTEKIIVSFEKDVEQLRRDLCRAIYHDLQEEYDYQTSDESLIESSDANDYTFDGQGRRE